MPPVITVVEAVVLRYSDLGLALLGDSETKLGRFPVRGPNLHSFMGIKLFMNYWFSSQMPH